MLRKTSKIIGNVSTEANFKLASFPQGKHSKTSQKKPGQFSPISKWHNIEYCQFTFKNSSI